MANYVNLPFSIINELGLPWHNIELTIDEVDDHGWKTCSLVFEYQGKFYSTSYMHESNEGIIWDIENFVRSPEFIKCVKVKPVQKMITVYEEV
jgi:hypothetical protein